LKSVNPAEVWFLAFEMGDHGIHEDGKGTFVLKAAGLAKRRDALHPSFPFD